VTRPDTAERRPTISVLTPVYDTDPQILQECLASIAEQTYTDWEHVLVDDASPLDHVWPQLQLAAQQDPRRSVHLSDVNGGIVGASNRALELARGRIVVLLDHDDLLAPHALERIAAAFAADDDVDYVYSDEDVLLDGERVDPFYKPDWSPERFRNQMYTCHVSAFRTELVREVGGFHEEFEGSQDWDLVLRVTERARRIVHLPEVLYHWRVVPSSVLSGEDVKPYAYESAARALAAHAERVGLDVEVVEQRPRGYFRLVRRHHDQPLVSIVIPTRCSSGVVWGAERVMVLEAVRSIVERSTWTNYEVVAVVDRPAETDRAAHDQVMAELAELLGDRLVVVDWERPFNFSEKCNAGAAAASGEHLVFLNDDVEVIDGNWLEVLVGFVREPDVGAAGLRLLFSDGRLQHAGHVLLGGNPGHLMFGLSPTDTANRMALSLDREVAGVTAACLAIRAEVFDEVGAFSVEFAGNYNDVDLCCKLRHLGYRIVVSAQASLYHFESISRDPTVGEHELTTLRRRWHHELHRDPFYNPNYGAYDNYPFPLSYP
jgi:GT2 family glycosyltransferase